MAVWWNALQNAVLHQQWQNFQVATQSESVDAALGRACLPAVGWATILIQIDSLPFDCQ